MRGRVGLSAFLQHTGHRPFGAGLRMASQRGSVFLLGVDTGSLALEGSSSTIPVSGLAWRKLRTWRR